MRTRIMTGCPLPCGTRKTARLAMAIIALMAAACSRTVPSAPGDQPGRVIVEFRADETVAMKEVAEGGLDLLYSGLTAGKSAAFASQEAGKVLKVDAANINLSILLNPAPDAEPWIVRGSDGKERFNPFGPSEARRALNRLIDRVAISRELDGGSAKPILLPFRPGSAGSAPWYREAFSEGFAIEGVPSAARDFNAAIERAAALPAMAGRLTLADGVWRFDGEPVAVRLLARVDDPDGAYPLAVRLRDILRGLGLAVELLEKERAGCVSTLTKTDPADLAWHAYTERWGSGGSVAERDPVMMQMYSVRYGAFQPAGAAMPDPWKPASPEADRLVDRLWEGNYRDRAEYEADMAELTRVALEDSFRIFAAQLDRSFLFSRAAFPETPPVDPEAGIGWWFWRGALTSKPDGEPLRVGLVSRAQTVFAATWNPVALYNLYAPIAWPVLESTVEPGPWNVTDPVTGESSWLCAEIAGIESGADAAARGDFSATVAVPATALRWDGAARAWKPAGQGVMARGKVALDYGRLRWHNGLKGSAADVLHWLAFRLDWSREDGPEDARFDQNVRDVHGFDLERTLAVEVLSPTRLAVYADWGWAMAPERLARLSAHAPAYCHWTIIQAAEDLVLAGGEPGERYAFEADDNSVPVDALEPRCVAALRARLVTLRDSGTVPAGIAGLVTAEEAAAAYAASIAFIDARGHAWISDGPYALDRVSFDPPYFELARYPEYRADNAETARRLSRTVAGIDGLSCPAMARRGEDIVVELRLSGKRWPSGTANPDPEGLAATIRLVSADAELERPAARAGKGKAVARFPGPDLAALGTGAVLVVAEAAVGGSLPAFATASLAIVP